MLFLAIAPVSASEPEQPKDDMKKVFIADDLTGVSIRTEKGGISVKGTDRLTVQAEKTDAVDSRMCMVVMEPDKDGKTLRLEVKRRQAFSPADCRTGFRVELPKRLNVRAVSGRGDINASGLEGDLLAEDGTGEIALDDLRGAVQARSSTGDVHGTITAAKGATVDTGNGAVRLKGLEGEVEIKTGGGEVQLWWAKPPKAGLKVKSSISTGSGNATVTLPEGLKIKTDLKSGTGHSVNELGDSPDADFFLSMASGSGSMSVLKAGQDKK